jgi:hypothetical protein
MFCDPDERRVSASRPQAGRAKARFPQSETPRPSRQMDHLAQGGSEHEHEHSPVPHFDAVAIASHPIQSGQRGASEHTRAAGRPGAGTPRTATPPAGLPRRAHRRRGARSNWQIRLVSAGYGPRLPASGSTAIWIVSGGQAGWRFGLLPRPTRRQRPRAAGR